MYYYAHFYYQSIRKVKNEMYGKVALLKVEVIEFIIQTLGGHMNLIII